MMLCFLPGYEFQLGELELARAPSFELSEESATNTIFKRESSPPLKETEEGSRLEFGARINSVPFLQIVTALHELRQCR